MHCCCCFCCCCCHRRRAEPRALDQQWRAYRVKVAAVQYDQRQQPKHEEDDDYNCVHVGGRKQEKCVRERSEWMEKESSWHVGGRKQEKCVRSK